MAKSTVLVVEDDADLRDVVRESLEDDGYAVVTAPNAGEGLKKIKASKIDIILLDLVLPDGDGLHMLGKIRAVTDAPVIVVSGKGAMVDKVVGLEMGADDYLGKPFEMRELSARIKANLRRYGGPDQPKKTGKAADVIPFGKWTLDRTKYQAFDSGGRPADLTILEYRLLEALVLAANRVLSRDQLLAMAREDSLDVYDRTIDIQIARIRKKLGDDARAPSLIKTVRGAGYMLVDGAEG